MKGLELWEKYWDKVVWDLDATDSFVEFPFDLDTMPATPSSPPKPGWTLENMNDVPEDLSDIEEVEEEEADDDEMEWVPVAVNRDGWRYEEVQIHYNRDLQAALRLTGKEMGSIKLTGYSCMEWRQPVFSLIAYVDCANGIFVVHNADFVYSHGKQTRSSHRFSGVSWMLWKTVCPQHYHHNLQYFIIEFITNQDTRKLLEEAAIGRMRFSPTNKQANDLVVTSYTPTLYSWGDAQNPTPTCDQDSGACDFYALLRSPNVIGVVHLLMDLVQTLSNPYISEIMSLSTYGQRELGKWFTGWNMVIKLEPQPC